MASRPDVHQARSFGAEAPAYARSRPSYPSEALRWLIPAESRRILDLGAGTGQVSRALIPLGYDVTAVEPSAEMRAEFQRALPDGRVLNGSAERIPLPDQSVDAALVAQAWHWFDVEMVLPELERVLCAGGQLGLLWNIRDEHHAWVAELGRIMRQGTEQDMGSESPRVGGPFGAIERRDFSWRYTIDRAGLLELVASRSYVITLQPAARRRVLSAVAQLLDTHPDLRGRDTLEIPYVTRCSRARLRGSAAAR